MANVKSENEPYRWTWERPPEEDHLYQVRLLLAEWDEMRAHPPPPDGPLVRFARRVERILGLHG